MADFSIVVEKLQGFESADDLAEYFRDCGIKARPGSARACAITVFVEQETGEVGNIITTTSCIELQKEVFVPDEWGGISYNETAQLVSHTSAMTSFVHGFDRGQYSFLIEDGFEPDVDESGCGCLICIPD